MDAHASKDFASLNLNTLSDVAVNLVRGQAGWLVVVPAHVSGRMSQDLLLRNCGGVCARARVAAPNPNPKP